MLETIILTLLGIFLLIGGIMILWAKYPSNIVMGFFISMLSISGLFALLGNGFLFLAQILVTIGAVVVVTLIVILDSNLQERNLPKEPFKALWIAICSLIVAPFGWMLYLQLTSLYHTFAPLHAPVFSAKSIGQALFTSWVLPFEILSLLLLAAMVGAIVIGKKEQSYES